MNTITIDGVTRTQTMLFYPIPFTGKERDEETGYGYFGARYMDYTLMTSFISVDRYASKYPFISLTHAITALSQSLCLR